MGLWRTLSSAWSGWRERRREEKRLRGLARASGDPFRESAYYSVAEPDMWEQWEQLIWPLVRDCDLTHTVELAPGHGRNSARLLEHASSLVLVDINRECLTRCRRRFGSDERVSYVLTRGLGFDGVDDDSATFVYCFDAMVHFEPEVVAAYLQDTARILRAGGQAFFHHSNRPLAPGAGFTDAVHWRNDMTLGRFAELADEAGLVVVRSKSIDWGSEADLAPGLDGLTLVRLPVRAAS